LEIKKSTLYLLCILTLVGFPLMAYVLLLFFDDTYFFKNIFISNSTLAKQLLIGFLYGCVIGLAGIGVIKNGLAKSVKSMLNKVFGNITITWVDIVFFSFCAGLGEELFFRGTIQHFIGIWPTAILFIFIHNYLSISSWRKVAFGTFMIIIVAGMGYLNNYFGIWAAIMAHFVYDVFMFAHLTKFTKPIPNEEYQNQQQS